ncbi:AraC family transcriptional regulator [Pseudomonas syringae]|nr:AraC family transcriptional regulator [Pseudomonas syringae]
MNTHDWVRHGESPSRIERIEAYFSGHGYTPHRHDTYAIGRTLAGVQSFEYQKVLRHSLPGGTLVLHPDELHDGMAGTEAGFHYRMIYVDPVLIQQVLGGRPLPFIKGGVCTDARMYQACEVFMQAMDCPLEALQEQDALFDLAQALQALAGKPRARRCFDYRAAERARDYIHSRQGAGVTLNELEQVSGRERWSLSRDFRALYGTSPYRYVTLRRLDLCRRLLRSGFALVDAALAAGFFDQSHMTRHFIACHGLSPSRWLRMQAR